MIFDANELSSGVVLEGDLCIIGGGVAGITLALALVDSGLKVVVLEGGGLEASQLSAALYLGEKSPVDYPQLHHCRLRYLGGSSNHWGGWTSPLFDSDLTQREQIAESGWPVPASELRRFESEAGKLLQLQGDTFTTDYWLGKNSSLSLMPGKDLVTHLYQLSPPTRFGSAYRGRLQKADNLYVMMNANAEDLLPAEKGGRSAVTLKCRNHRHRGFSVKASNFVVAAGGIENARLLLNFKQFSPKGLGNDSDNVGRYFSDHIGVKIGAAVIPGGQRWQQLYDPVKRYADAAPYGRAVGGLTFSPEYTKANRLPNAGMLFQFVDPDLAAKQGVIVNPGDAVVNLHISVEQQPNRRSRVTLTSDEDLLGMLKPHLDFRLDDGDKQRIALSAEHFSRLLGAELSARVHLDDLAWPLESPEYGSHHMGTTRMSLSPTTGVVDPNCRIHGMDNVFVAGSSVFPTYSFVQPTLTVVALALRLAEHLREVRYG